MWHVVSGLMYFKHGWNLIGLRDCDCVERWKRRACMDLGSICSGDTLVKAKLYCIKFCPENSIGKWWKKTTPYQVLPAYLSKQGLSLKPTTGIYFGHHSQLIQGTVQRVLIFLEKYFFFFLCFKTLCVSNLFPQPSSKIHMNTRSAHCFMPVTSKI